MSYEILNPMYTLDDDGKQLVIGDDFCPEESFISFYKLWRLQGYRNLILMKCYPFFQTIVLYSLFVFLIYLDYPKLCGYPLQPLNIDETLPSFFDFFKPTLFKNILLGILTLLMFISFSYHGFKLRQLTRDIHLIRAKNSLVKIDHINSQTDGDGFESSSMIMSTIQNIESIVIDNDESSSSSSTSSSSDESDDVYKQTNTDEIILEDDENKNNKTRNMFIERCAMHRNFMSKYINENDNIVRGGSHYLFKIIKDIYFPNKDFDFFNTISDMSHPKYDSSNKIWINRKHSHLFVIVSGIYNIITLALKYFGLLLTPSSLTKRRWSPYAINILRPKDSLPHEIETLFKKAEPLVEEVVSLTPKINLGVIVVLLVVVFTMNLRNEFQLFGISSTIILNVLITIVLFSYNSSDKEIHSETFDEAMNKLYEVLPRLKDFISEMDQIDQIQYIKSHLFVSLYEYLYNEIKAPLTIKEKLSNFEKEHIITDVQEKVIKEVIQQNNF
ncbi:Autophagy-related protein 9 [Entamoeba marina]